MRSVRCLANLHWKLSLWAGSRLPRQTTLTEADSLEERIEPELELLLRHQRTGHRLHRVGVASFGLTIPSWRTTDPNCFLRVLSVHPHVTSKDIAAVTDLLAKAKPFDRAPKALGKNAFFAHTDLGPGAAIAIERVYVPSGDRNWVEVTLSGRLGPDGSRGLLVTAAKAVPRLAPL